MCHGRRNGRSDLSRRSVTGAGQHQTLSGHTRRAPCGQEFAGLGFQRLGLHGLANQPRQAVATGLETIRHQNQQQIRRVVGHQAQAHGSKFKVHNSFFP
jgi:hypothetical protein